jgi:reactive intermediate/imine deaminase
LQRVDRAPGVIDPLGPYSHAVVVGGFVHVAGQVGVGPDGKLVGPGDAEAQTRQVYANLDAVLRAAGSGLDRLVKLTVYLTNMADLPAASRVRRELFTTGEYPASTVVQVSQLADPGWLIEVDAVAYVRADE